MDGDSLKIIEEKMKLEYHLSKCKESCVHGDDDIFEIYDELMDHETAEIILKYGVVEVE